MHVTHGGLVTQTNAFYFEMIEKTVDSLIDTGILSYLIEKDIGKKLKFGQAESEPKVLNMDDLSFGFNIWLGCCVFSAICFVIELVGWPIKKCRLKNKVEFLTSPSSTSSS